MGPGLTFITTSHLFVARGKNQHRPIVWLLCVWHSTGLGSPGGADHWERTGGGGRNGSVRAESCRHLLSRSGNIGSAFHNIMTNGGCGMLSGDRGCVQDHMFPRFICVCVL